MKTRYWNEDHPRPSQLLSHQAREKGLELSSEEGEEKKEPCPLIYSHVNLQTSKRQNQLFCIVMNNVAVMSGSSCLGVLCPTQGHLSPSITLFVLIWVLKCCCWE